MCLLQTFPFLVDPGTDIPIKHDLPTLGKRSANCVAHAKQDKSVICKIVFNGFSAFNKGSSFSYHENKDLGSSFSYYENEDRVLGLRSSFSRVFVFVTPPSVLTYSLWSL